MSGERVMRGLLSFPDTLRQQYISEQRRPLPWLLEPTFSWKIFKNYCSVENRQKSAKIPGHQGKKRGREDFCKRYSEYTNAMARVHDSQKNKREQ